MGIDNFALEELEVIRQLIKLELSAIESDIGDLDTGEIPPEKMAILPYRWILRDIDQKIDSYLDK